MPRNEEKKAVLVFLKVPVENTVKTRLALTLGVETTLDVYRCFIHDTLEKAEKAGKLKIFFYPFDQEEILSGFLIDVFPGKTWPLQAQEGEDLGERMASALEHAFHHGFTKAVVIGTDSPDMPVTHLEEAFRMLDETDAVVGPSNDGGYVLIGFTREGYSPAVFKGITWSTPSVFEKTLEVMARDRISCHILPPWFDVDTGEDFNALAERLTQGLSTAGRTRSFIETMRARETRHLRHHPRPE
jgi:rSAM/selenodomain-associated transferase 1